MLLNSMSGISVSVCVSRCWNFGGTGVSICPHETPFNKSLEFFSPPRFYSFCIIAWWFIRTRKPSIHIVYSQGPLCKKRFHHYYINLLLTFYPHLVSMFVFLTWLLLLLNKRKTESIPDCLIVASNGKTCISYIT